jgi:hypothetical protein
MESLESVDATAKASVNEKRENISFRGSLRLSKGDYE